MKLAVINGKIGTVQLDAAIGLALTHAGEGPQIFKAYLDCGIFHRAACFRRITMRVHHFLTRFIKKADPAGNEAAFPQAGIFEALIQRRTATAAAAMALLRFKMGVMPVLGASALAGLALRLAGWA